MVSGMPRPLLSLALLTGCASTYAYTFQAPGARHTPDGFDTLEDADVRAAVRVDAAGQAVRLDITNKTDQVLEVGWADISLARADGAAAPLRPLADLGWIGPGATQTADLLPLVLPRRDDAARRDDGRTFRLSVPMIVRREPKTYRVQLVAKVEER